MEGVANWDKLSWQERREARFQRWLDAPGVEFDSPEARAAYRERVTRFIRVLKMEEPDRVPVLLPAGYLPATYSGGTFKEKMYDYARLRDAWLRFMRDFSPDSFEGPGLVYPGRVIEIIDHKLHRWPGHGLPDGAPMYQFVEGEYMKADEYEDFMSNPTDYWMRVFLPRTAGAFEGFRYLAPFQPVMTNPLGYIMSVSRPEVQASFEKLLEASREMANWGREVMKVSRQALAEGYASFGGGGMAGAPFDNLADALRGTRGIVMDMYRQPDKVIEAMERLVPIIVKGAVRGAERSFSPVIMMPLHKGDRSFMSPDQFEKFYWPTFKKVLLGLVEEGLVPYPFAEGNYEPRLETISDMPRTAIAWHFEVMDMAKAKKTVGKVSCIAGNVPTSLLVTGTAAQVRESCRKLIETCAPGGGYILTGGAGMNVGDANNLHVMMQAAKEFGVYGEQ